MTMAVDDLYNTNKQSSGVWCPGVRPGYDIGGMMSGVWCPFAGSGSPPPEWSWWCLCPSDMSSVRSCKGRSPSDGCRRRLFKWWCPSVQLYRRSPTVDIVFLHSSQWWVFLRRHQLWMTDYVGLWRCCPSGECRAVWRTSVQTLGPVASKKLTVLSCNNLKLGLIRPWHVYIYIACARWR